MKKIINNTASDFLINDIGINIPASGEVVVDPVNYVKLTQSNDLINGLSSNIISYSDGVSELSLVDAIGHINGFSEKTPRSNIQNAQPVIMLKAEDPSFARATHDFCNKNTWYYKSVRVVGELPTNVGLVYSLSNINIIDVVNGVVNRQDTLQDYRVAVYDDGIEITDYTIDHTNGKITLDSSPLGTITVDYSYATTSEWVIAPDPGKILIIEHSEVQFATDVEMNTPIRFEIWVYNPNDLPNKIPYQVIQYNCVKDLVNEANLGTGTIPAMVGLPECVVFPFNYVTIKPLMSSVGAELRVRSVNDLELSGSFGTASFYLVSKDDI